MKGNMFTTFTQMQGNHFVMYEIQRMESDNK